MVGLRENFEEKKLIFNFQNDLSGRPALTFGMRSEKAASFGRILLVLANWHCDISIKMTGSNYLSFFAKWWPLVALTTNITLILTWR